MTPEFILRQLERFMNREYVFKCQNKVHNINLIKSGWKYGLNDRKTALGITIKGKSKRIEVSTYFFNLNNSDKRDELKEVLYHEIAHALDIEVRKKSNHDKVWKNIALQIGSTGERLCKSKFSGQESKYTLVCPHCERETRSHKKPKRLKGCGICLTKANYSRYLKYNKEKADQLFKTYQLRVVQNY